MIEGTPVLDIKPYISDYDSPHSRLDIDTDTYDSGVQPESTSVPTKEGTTSVETLHSDSVASFSCTVDPQLDLGVERQDSHSTEYSTQKTNPKFKSSVQTMPSALMLLKTQAKTSPLCWGSSRPTSARYDYLALGSSVGKCRWP